MPCCQWKMLKKTIHFLCQDKLHKSTEALNQSWISIKHWILPVADINPILNSELQQVLNKYRDYLLKKQGSMSKHLARFLSTYFPFWPSNCYDSIY